MVMVRFDRPSPHGRTGPISTVQVLLDLPLDIYDRNVNSLQTAMRAFAAVEQLEPNTYMCEKCKKRVSASKKFRVEVLPQYLTIQLKRFGLGTTKISKSIEFPHRLNAKDVASENLHPADCQYPWLFIRPRGMVGGRQASQTSEGSFSAVSTPIFASKHSFCSIFRDL